MSDNYTDEEFDTDVEQEDMTPKGLRRAANKAKKLEEELNSIRRELAFAKAGLPMDDPRLKYFVKGYDGEMDAEAIREAAVEAGFLQSSEPTQEPEKVQDFSAQARVMQASAGAVTEDISEEAAIARMEEAMREGGIPALLDVAQQYGIPTSE